MELLWKKASSFLDLFLKLLLEVAGGNRRGFKVRRLAEKSVVIQCLSCIRIFVTSWTVDHQAPLSFTISRSLLRFMSSKSVMLSNHLILCCPLLLLPLTFPSIRVFSSESALHFVRPQCWSLSSASGTYAWPLKSFHHQCPT